MTPLPTYGSSPVVLLTNDDGPPSSSSPNIFEFSKLLQSVLGWQVKVVIPDCQKSWVGKAYAISEVVAVRYFYPSEPDGLKGEISTIRRPLKEGESMEWVLISGTPASCTNIALHNLYPGEIDLVISGPNHGRNSSAAFSLSSGTLGAALAAALSVPLPGPSSGPSLHIDHIPSIAISYGVVDRPIPPRAIELAHEAAVEVCKRLWDDWGYESLNPRRRVQVYSVNIPLVEDKLETINRKVCWATMWRNTYGGLFKPNVTAKTNLRSNRSAPPQLSTTASAGPGAMPISEKEEPATPVEDTGLTFHFAPDLKPLLFTPIDQLPVGTDAWAFAMGYVTVTPISAEFSGLSIISLE
ncbi:hypothetical protein TREMEDRAFT_68211 [Tremella mesenterica DSM 1558]|uniref:uncharacterized protein n=1 Tax=Tremella mesenterica (strain ATCC 24925 / CBS 8224 / DSM 1558 / NBRC 9311 / NRRL Y-6157 / RJB 2259-6 / UBC 559-6) TaxID=578456 RepID=UPI0003F49E35|nr:uncharacterized protein TREMEDRAFT_68211 [Tremella mesenterica DSM 1558]EIW70773.1 hypothetical protein TREMEDRAFT_68211 [Tremella mesenterica DSM 1558]